MMTERSQIRRETRMLPGGGGSGSGSGTNCCCCITLQSGNVYMSDGIHTVETWRPCERLNPIKITQQFGKLTITPPDVETMLFEKESGGDRFVYEFEEGAFSATDHEGNDVTASLVTPEGSAIFEHSVAVSGGGSGSGESGTCGCPQMRLRIEWDAEIPDPDPSGLEDSGLGGSGL